MGTLQGTTTLPWGSGTWNSCNMLPHCPAGSGQRNSCNALPHRLGAAHSGTLAMCGPTSHKDGEVCPGGGLCLKNGTFAMHCHIACGQWAVELWQCTVSLLGGSGHCNFYQKLPHCLRACGQCNSCNALPHRLAAAGSAIFVLRGPRSWGDGESCPRGGHCLKDATPAIHCHIASGESAVELLSCTHTLLRGSGQWNYYNALPHCSGAAGSGTPAMHCLTARG